MSRIELLGMRITVRVFAALWTAAGAPVRALSEGEFCVGAGPVVRDVSNEAEPLSSPFGEQGPSVVAFLEAAVAHYKALGVTIKRLITDNGPAYRSKLFARACQAMGIKHTFTRPYRPPTNGKAERFIRTCLHEWAYGRSWPNSQERTARLPAFLAYCNARKPHSALGYKPPASRLGGNNLLQINTVASLVALAAAQQQPGRCQLGQFPRQRAGMAAGQPCQLAQVQAAAGLQQQRGQHLLALAGKQQIHRVQGVAHKATIVALRLHLASGTHMPRPQHS